MRLRAKTDIKVKGAAKVAKGETFDMAGPAAKYLVADGHAEVVELEPAEQKGAGPLDTPTATSKPVPVKKK